MSNWEAVVFDLDDTLFPESEYVLSGFRAVSLWAEEQLGIPCELAFRTLEELFRNGIRGDTFNRWLDTAGIAVDERLISQVMRVYRDHAPPILNPFPEVPGLLWSLHRSLRLGIVSDGYLDVQKRKWAALGLAPYFSAVVFSDQWGREFWKPHRRPFLAAAGMLGVAPEKTVYVGDNPLKDFYGARRAGMYAIRVKRDEGEHASLIPASEPYEPHVTISTLNELPEILGHSH